MFKPKRTITTKTRMLVLTLVDGTVFRAVRTCVERYEYRITRNDEYCAQINAARRWVNSRDRERPWDIKVAPGIDPVLMVAFAAVLDKLIG